MKLAAEILTSAIKVIACSYIVLSTEGSGNLSCRRSGYRVSLLDFPALESGRICTQSAARLRVKEIKFCVSPLWVHRQLRENTFLLPRRHQQDSKAPESHT